MARPTVLLADDHTIVMEGLQKLLEPNFEVVGAVQNGRDLVAAARQIQPDVVLVDISMPELNGIDAATQIRRELPAAKLIFLTMHADRVYLDGAFRAGANGYILKRCASAELVDGIQTVLRGRAYITPEIAGEFGPAVRDPAKAPVYLSAREREVLQLIAEGKSVKEIALALQISVKTVGFHKTNIRHKVGVRTTAELTRFAMRHGVVGN